MEDSSNLALALYVCFSLSLAWLPVPAVSACPHACKGVSGWGCFCFVVGDG